MKVRVQFRETARGVEARCDQMSVNGTRSYSQFSTGTTFLVHFTENDPAPIFGITQRDIVLMFLGLPRNAYVFYIYFISRRSVPASWVLDAKRHESRYRAEKLWNILQQHIFSPTELPSVRAVGAFLRQIPLKIERRLLRAYHQHESNDTKTPHH